MDRWWWLTHHHASLWPQTEEKTEEKGREEHKEGRWKTMDIDVLGRSLSVSAEGNTEELHALCCTLVSITQLINPRLPTARNKEKHKHTAVA